MFGLVLRHGPARFRSQLQLSHSSHSLGPSSARTRLSLSLLATFSTLALPPSSTLARPPFPLCTSTLSYSLQEHAWIVRPTHWGGVLWWTCNVLCCTLLHDVYTLCPYYVLLIIISCIYSLTRKHACAQLLATWLFIHSIQQIEVIDTVTISLSRSTLLHVCVCVCVCVCMYLQYCMYMHTYICHNKVVQCVCRHTHTYTYICIMYLRTHVHATQRTTSTYIRMYVCTDHSAKKSE